MFRLASSILAFTIVFGAAGWTVAQDDTAQQEEKTYRGEFDYQLGQTLDVGVTIDGVTWESLAVEGTDSGDYVLGKKVKITVTDAITNANDSSRSLSLIILFEDARGRQLERTELRSIRIRGGHSDEDVQKVKVDGGTLAEVGKVYLFAEVK